MQANRARGAGVLAFALGICGAVCVPMDANAQCPKTQDSFTASVNGVPPPSPQNTLFGVLLARRVNGGDINFFGQPWGDYTGCLSVGEWRFKAFDEEYGWSPSWHSGVSCVKVAAGEVDCSGGVSITLHKAYTREENNPSHRPRCPTNGPAPGTCTVAEPVSVVTGNMFLNQTDFVLPGWGPGLNLTRSYNSGTAYWGHVGAFGAGWSHTYEKKLEISEPQVLMIREANGVATFYWDSDGDLMFEGLIPANETSAVVDSGGTHRRNFPDGSYETYDSSGNLTRMVDAVGNTVSLTYTATGELSGITDPASRQLTYTYTGSRITRASGPGGLIATYTYDGNDLASVTYPDGSGYRFSYATFGRLRQVSDHEGVILEKHTYSRQFATSSEISDGQELYTLEYREDGDPAPINQTIVTDALGNVTNYDWEENSGARYVTKITGACASCGASGGESQEWAYDGEGRVLSYKGGLGNTTTYTYDANGYLAGETDPLNRTTTYTNDSQGRILTRTDPANGVTTWTYSPAGPLTIKDPINRTTTITYHPQGKPKTIRDPRQKTTTLGYDSAGNLISVTDPLGNETQYGYDLVGRRTSK